MQTRNFLSLSFCLLLITSPIATASESATQPCDTVTSWSWGEWITFHAYSLASTGVVSAVGAIYALAQRRAHQTILAGIQQPYYSAEALNVLGREVAKSLGLRADHFGVINWAAVSEQQKREFLMRLKALVYGN